MIPTDVEVLYKKGKSSMKCSCSSIKQCDVIDGNDGNECRMGRKWMRRL